MSSPLIGRFWWLVSLALILFDFIFPKAGLKLSGTPLYLSVFLSVCFALPRAGWRAWREKNRDGLFFLIYSGLIVLAVVMERLIFPLQMGLFSTVNAVLPVGIALLAFWLVYYPLSEDLSSDWVGKLAAAALVAVVGYGLLQRVFGEFHVMVPGLTVNLTDALNIHSQADYQKFLFSKHNYLYGLGSYKMTSTYQNGNVLGVNLLLFSWIGIGYFFQKKEWWGKAAAGLLLVMLAVGVLWTGSATAYLGFLASLAFLALYFLVRQMAKSSSRRGLWVLLGGIGAALAVMVLVVVFVKPVREMLDTRFFHRNWLANERFAPMFQYFQYLWNSKNWTAFLFGSVLDPLRQGFIYEITPLSVFQNLGLLVFAGWLALLVRWLLKLPFRVETIGIFAYLVACLTDGAFWLPPTAFSFFLVLGYGVKLKREKTS